MSDIQDLFERQYPNENSTSSFEKPPSPDGPRRIPLDLADSKINKADSQDSRNQLKNIRSHHQYQNSSLFQTQDNAAFHNSQISQNHIHQNEFNLDKEKASTKTYRKHAKVNPALSPTSKNLDKHMLAYSSPSISDSIDSEDYSQRENPAIYYQHLPSRHIQKNDSNHRKKKTGKKGIDFSKSGSSRIKAMSSRNASSSSSEIKDIKSSLKEHFEAIKSLQTALSIGKPLKESHTLNSEKSTKPIEQSSNDIRQRIKMIEATLREVGEPVSMSETNSDQIRRGSHLDMNGPLFQLHSQKPPIAPTSTSSAALDVEKLNQRLDTMERAMKNLSNNEKKVAGNEGNESTVPKNTIVIENSGQLTKLMSEIHKLRFDFKNQEKLNQELFAKNTALEKRVENLQSGKGLQSDGIQIDPKIQGYFKNLLQKHKAQMESILNEKVDTVVLEELAHHIATKEELKKYVKKTSLNKLIIENSAKGTNLPFSKGTQDKDGIIEKLKGKVNKLAADIKGIETRLPSVFALSPEKQSELFIQGQMFDLESKMHKRLQDWVLEKIHSQVEVIEMSNDQKIAIAKESVQNTVKALISDTVRKALEDAPTDFMNIDAQSHPLIRKMVRDFDEKLYTVCSDLSACKQLFVNQSNQPFYRCAQWMWTSGSLKLGSAVPWNLQTSNTDPDNFKWDQDHFNIRIAEAGLYEINLAFFTKAKPSIQLVVNGESVLSAINSPSYVIQHSSGFVMDGNGKVEPGTVTGISLVDFLALPSKSTLSIHYHGVKKNPPAHGFLGLKRL